MKLKCLLLVCYVVIIGCSTPNTDANWPKPIPLAKNLQSYRAPQDHKKVDSKVVELSTPKEILTLRDTLVLVLMKNPELAAFSWEVRAGEARTLQAGMLPNPEFSVEAEDFGGQDERKAFDGVEVTIQFSQLIELGGKVAKRTRLAALERDLSAWNYESKRLEILAKVSKAFVGVLASQEEVKLTKQLLELTKKVYETVSARVESGKVSPIELTKTKIVLSSAQIEWEQAKRTLDATKKRLASFWGDLSPTFKEVKGDYYKIFLIPSAEKLKQKLSYNPDIARWKMELAKHKAAIKLEEVQKIPDITVNAGVRFFNETDDQAFLLGTSLPLPIFNRNQGNILNARYQLARARKQSEATRLRIHAEFNEAYQELSSSFLEVNSLQKNILPDARSVFDSVTEGYRQGKFNYLEVLDAQRTLFDAQIRYTKALSRYHKGISDIERLIASKVFSTKNQKEKQDEK